MHMSRAFSVWWCLEQTAASLGPRWISMINTAILTDNVAGLALVSSAF